MPIRKTRQSREEKKRCLARLQQLEREGIDVGIFDKLVEELRPVEITVGHGPMTSVFDLPSGCVGYEVWVSMVGLEPVEGEIELATDYDDQIMLENFDQRKETWYLGRRSYHRTEVLNPFLDPCLRFRSRGHRFEGTILATGLAPIPPEYCDKKLAPLKLIFRDQFGHEFTEQAELYVDRSAKRVLSTARKNRLRDDGGLAVPADMITRHRRAPGDSVGLPETKPDLGKPVCDSVE